MTKPLEDLYWSTLKDKETMSSFVGKVEEIVTNSLRKEYKELLESSQEHIASDDSDYYFDYIPVEVIEKKLEYLGGKEQTNG